MRLKANFQHKKQENTIVLRRWFFRSQNISGYTKWCQLVNFHIRKNIPPVAMEAKLARLKRGGKSLEMVHFKALLHSYMRMPIPSEYRGQRAASLADIVYPNSQISPNLDKVASVLRRMRYAGLSPDLVINVSKMFPNSQFLLESLERLIRAPLCHGRCPSGQLVSR